MTIPALSLLFLQNRQTQTMVTKYLVERLSEELQTSITLSSINYSFFKRIHIQDLYVEDLYGDTLLYSELTKVRIKQIRPDGEGIEIKKITVENVYFNLVIDSSNIVNLSFIIDRLKKPHVPPEKKNRLHIAEIEMIDGNFTLSRMMTNTPKAGVNLNDLSLQGIQISVENLISELDTVRMDIISLTGLEKSGFEIASLSSLFSVGKTHLHFSDLVINTKGSDLNVPVLTFDFDHYKDFKRFSSKVDLVFDSDQSLLKIADLSYFVPGTEGMLDHIEIDGSVFGKLNDLRGEELFVTFDQNSSLAFDFMMIGLPEFKNTFLEFNFRELNTSVNAVNDLLSQVQDTTGKSMYPWINLGNLDFRGRFTGYPDNFVATGLLQTDMGGMVMDLSFKPDSAKLINFNGRLRTNDFRLGEFLNQEEALSELDMNVFVDGSLYLGEIRANMTGTVDSLEFYEYAYSNITLDGAFTNKTFDGGFSISDPNIRLDFLGRMDFSGEVPVYNFTADVARARPYFLKLGVEDPNTFASFLIETDMSGKTLDELNGEIRLINSYFSRENSQLQLYDFNISTTNTEDSSRIQIHSEMFDATIEGKYRLSGLPGSFRNLADRYLNVIPEQEPHIDSLNKFTFSFDFKRVNPLLDFFYSDLQIGSESKLYGTYDPYNQKGSAIGSFSNIQLSQNIWTNVEINSEIDNQNFELHFLSDSMNYGKNISLEKQQFILTTAYDTAKLDMSWDNQQEPRYSGNIGLTGTFQSDSIEGRGFIIDVEATDIFINNDLWNISEAAILLKKQFISIDSLTFTSRDRLLLADGYISANENQAFNLSVKNMSLAELSMLAGLNAELSGNITGNINFQQEDGNPYIFSDLTVDTLFFNKQLLGTTSLNATWNDSRRTINMRLLSETSGSRIVDVDGSFSPGSKTLDFDIHLNGFELRTLNPYSESVARNLGGTGNINLTLDGTLQEPEFNGTMTFNDGAATIAFLNTRYTINDHVRIYNNNIYMEDLIAVDEAGNSARVNGTITNTHLRNFYTSINIEANNLMCMNTRSSDSDLLYGSIFATGNIAINGPVDAIKLTIKATTERNTAIFLPLYTAREVKSSDFISFIQDESQEEKIIFDRVRKIGGLEMELDLNITQDAVVQMIFDPKLGDIIESSGRGNLQMMLDQSSGFTMFGDVELLKGDYLFTLQNVINKRFQIESGGKIKFNGSPTDATVDLEAIYTTRAAPYNLYPGDPSEAESLKKRIPVECRLNLQGELLSPSISTGIAMPTADPETRDLLVNATSTEEELMKQFLSLLIINNFYSVTGYGGQDMGVVNSSVAGVTASELLSNQLSNWLSQISDDFDIGVNYRPGDEVTSDEVELALSTQLLDDRIIISGNVDVGGQETNPSSGAANNPYIVGDFDVEFKLTDNISVIAFNRARDELLYETAPYKQGIGISYKEEFNDLNQLIQRYREGLTNRKKKKKNSDKAELEE